MSYGVPLPSSSEREGLVAAGAIVRRHRERLGLSRAALSRLAGLHDGYVAALEAGRRRVRESSLHRIAAALVPAGEVDALVAELVEAAGAGLAAESAFEERQARRQARRERNRAPESVKAARSARAELAKLIALGERLGWDSERLGELRSELERFDADIERLRVLAKEHDPSQDAPPAKTAADREALAQFREALAGFDRQIAELGQDAAVLVIRNRDEFVASFVAASQVAAKRNAKAARRKRYGNRDSSIRGGQA